MDAWNSNYECLDITHKEASKLHGVVDVLKLLDIDMQDVIGIGDGYNDFPLLFGMWVKDSDGKCSAGT